jgi:SSS family solute:Na+ symporter
VKQARRAFYIAGLLEYPLMAFLGVSLGLMARVAFPAADAETAMPMLLRQTLPTGVAGIVLAAYFSAIMSTADSCLIASSGHWVNDILEHRLGRAYSTKLSIRLSQVTTLVLGLIALLLAMAFTTVLDIIMSAYAVMVAGLLIPTLIALFVTRPNARAALCAMIGGCTLTAWLIVMQKTRQTHLPAGLDPSVFGITGSLFLYGIASLITRISHARHH